jgi:hypothetical protein
VTHGRRQWWAARPTTPPDRGSATAELAVGLPALVLLTIVAVTAVGAVLTQLRCVDAAREGARAQARGEPGIAAAERVAPPGATVSVELADGRVRATVRVTVHPLGGRLPGFEVSAVSVAALEPVAMLEPVAALEPVAMLEPVAALEPVAVRGPVAALEPVVVRGPVAALEPVGAYPPGAGP